MNKKVFSWDNFNRVPIVGIVRNFSVKVIKDLPVFGQSGLTKIEITMNTKGREKPEG